jgi:hypothetical protein
VTWRSLRYFSAAFWPLWSLLCSIGLWIRACGWWGPAVIVTASAVLSTGCGSLPPVAPPGEPRMVLEAEGRVRLATFDEAAGEFVDLGWHDAAGLRGWTIADYDWTP